MSRHVVAGGESFTGLMRSATCYVLEGRCRYVFDEETVDLHAGQLAVLPGGAYRFLALDGHVDHVLAWELPTSVAP